MSSETKRQTRTVTLKDVAVAAGVSTSTVSRALRTPQAVSQARRMHIQGIAAQMGYTPNSSARELTTGKRFALGVMVPDLENPLFAALIKSAQARARWWGYSMTVVDTGEDPELEAEGLKLLASKSDGSILFSPRLADVHLREYAHNSALVLVNREFPEITSLTIDESTSMLQTVRHLTALGHSKIAYISGPRTSWSDRARHAAVIDAIDGMSSSSPVDLKEIGHTAPSFEGGVSAADWVLASGVSAVICHNDLIALGILSRCIERGVRLPDDLSIVGHDGIQAGGFVTPALTTIAMPLRDMGRDAVDLLMAVMANEPPKRLRVSAHLNVRASTTVPSGTPPE